MSSKTSSSSSSRTPLSLVNSVKGARGSPFFHARIEQAGRIDNTDLDSYPQLDPISALPPYPQAIEGNGNSLLGFGVSSHVQDSNNMFADASYYAVESNVITVPNGCEEQPLPSRKHDVFRSLAEKEQLQSHGHASSSVHPSTSCITSRLPLQVHPSRLSAKSRPRPASSSGAAKFNSNTNAMPMSTDDQEFWAMVADTPIPTPVSRRYHYLTRSQSTGSFQHSPKLQKQKNASYSSSDPVPAYPGSMPAVRGEYDPQEPEVVDSAVIDTSDAWLPAQRHLSPIDEGPFFPDKQESPHSPGIVQYGDNASLHSTISASGQSNLFLNRPVRRTTSTSTLNSTNTLSQKGSPDDPLGTYSTGPSRSYPRTYLPVIPASPRESQNVYEVEPSPPVLKFPLPVVYPTPIEYAPFQPPMDVVEPDFILAGSQAPSLITRSESIRTELTYLTAPDSGAGSRRVSRVTTHRRSRLADSDIKAEKYLPASVARLKSSIETFFTKSTKLTSSALQKPLSASTEQYRTRDVESGGVGGDGAGVRAKGGGLSKSAKDFTLAMVAHVRAPWDMQGKPSEILFWTGFVAPWCWLIGGWMLTRSGHTVEEGEMQAYGGSRTWGVSALPAYREVDPAALQSMQSHQSPAISAPTPAASPPPSAPSQQQQQQQQQQSTQLPQPPKNIILLAYMRARIACMAFLTFLLPHPRLPQHHTTNTPSSTSNANVNASAETRMQTLPASAPRYKEKLDPWVVRCRIAAVVSGMFVLALCIVAMIVLVRAL